MTSALWRLRPQVQIGRRLVREHPADVRLAPLDVQLVRDVHRTCVGRVERASIARVAGRKDWRDLVALERREIVYVLRAHQRELSLQAPHATREVGGELEVAAARRVRALPPA